MCSPENTVAAAAGMVVVAGFVVAAFGETEQWCRCERTDVMLRLKERERES